MKKYKLTNQNLQTHVSYQWKLGVKHTIRPALSGNTLCSDEVYHYYDTPLLAILLNLIHANIQNPRLFEVSCSKSVVHDGLKGGTKSMTLTKEIPVPEISRTQRIAFGILCVLEVYKERSFVTWAKNWLSGKDRSIDAAANAADAAYVAAYAANAAYAADAAAAVKAAYVAADAAAKTADVAYAAAYVAARAADVAKAAAYTATKKPINLVKLAETAMKVDM